MTRCFLFAVLLSVAFVMRAWGKQLGVDDKIEMLADANRELTKALGIEVVSKLSFISCVTCDMALSCRYLFLVFDMSGLRRWTLDPASRVRFLCGCPYIRKKAAPLGVVCQWEKRHKQKYSVCSIFDRGGTLFVYA